MLYVRWPTEAELSRSLDFVAAAEAELESVQDLPQRTLQAWSALCRSMIAANEFVYID
jgi:hypothetical protein